MSDESKKIDDVVIPSALLGGLQNPTESKGEKEIPKNELLRHDFVKQLKRAYIDYGIKINDDDPLIAVLIGQNVLIDLYEQETTKHIDSKFDALERALSTFPVRVSEELNERAENFLTMVEKVDSQVEQHLNAEFTDFQKRVAGYAQDTEKYLRSIKAGDEPKQTNSISGIKIFGLCFVSSLFSVTIALVAFYYGFLMR